MKLLPVSDLHLERRKLEDIAPLDDAFDVLVCAGDIWEGEPEKSVQAIVELARASSQSSFPAIMISTLDTSTIIALSQIICVFWRRKQIGRTRVRDLKTS